MYMHTRMVHRYRDTNQVKTHLMIRCVHRPIILYGVWRLSMRVEGLGEEVSDLPRGSRAHRVPWRIFSCPARLAYREHGVISSAHAPRSIRVCGLEGGDVGGETSMDLGCGGTRTSQQQHTHTNVQAHARAGSHLVRHSRGPRGGSLRRALPTAAPGRQTLFLFPTVRVTTLEPPSPGMQASAV